MSVSFSNTWSQLTVRCILYSSTLCGCLLSSAAYPQGAGALQPRDLDGDPVTIEAYFNTLQNITWLADTNLGKKNTFGLERGPITDYGNEINDNGEMLRGALSSYISKINSENYLGHNGWRLPMAQTGDDSGCSMQLNNGAITWGTGCNGPEAGEFNAMLINTYGRLENSPFINLDSRNRWLRSSGPSGRHYYSFGGEGELNFCGSGRCQPAIVWLVHDGDIGTPVNAGTCIDTDGDGWGWDGVASCFLRSVSTACIDTLPLNDGWGWNGVSSCRTETPPQRGDCFDSDPVGDGWGWDGVDSCVITATELINLATGEKVSTTKLRWSQENLIAGPLLCEAFSWNEADSNYIAASPRKITQYSHYSDGNGRTIELHENGNNAATDFSWSLQGGKYQGDALISNSYRIEDTPRGFNVWSDSLNFSHCTGIHSSDEAIEPCLYAASDSDGDGYGWENKTSCVVTDTSSPERELFSLVTGEQVNLVNLHWTEDDFKYRAIECRAYHHSGNEYQAGKLLNYYVHNTELGQVSRSWIVRPWEMTGLRQLPDESVIILDFDAVKTYTEDRTVAHFKIDQMPISVPATELVIRLNNIDQGHPAGTFDVFVFSGDGVISIDEWDAGTLHTSFYGIENPGELRLDVTEVLQQAIDNGNSYLSFRFTGGAGTDRYSLIDDGSTLQSATYSVGSYWLDGGIYHGPAPIDPYAQLIWKTNYSNGIRSWESENKYTECLDAQPSGF